MNWYEFVVRNRSEVFERSLEHIGLGRRVDGHFACDRIAAGHCVGSPRPAAALGDRSRQCGANDSEPRSVRVSDSGAVDRRHWSEHSHCRAVSIRFAADFAEYLHGDRGGRSGGDRVRARHGNDAAASALASSVAAGRACFARGNSGGDRDLYRRDHHRRRHWRGRPRSFYFSRA